MDGKSSQRHGGEEEFTISYSKELWKIVHAEVRGLGSRGGY